MDIQFRDLDTQDGLLLSGSLLTHLATSMFSVRAWRTMLAGHLTRVQTTSSFSALSSLLLFLSSLSFIFFLCLSSFCSPHSFSFLFRDYPFFSLLLDQIPFSAVLEEL
jgi:hypothetical protein